MPYLKRLLRHLVPLVAVITLIYGVLYIVAQQNLRIGANDPQVQMAQDAAYSLQVGHVISSVLPSPSVDISRSLAAYLVVYDESGKPLAGSGYLQGQLPALPTGVFDFTRLHGEDRLTWQPESGVRSALVVVHYAGPKSGFVMAGRSLREVENREDQLLLQVGAGWLGTIVLTGLVVVVAGLLLPS